MKFDIHHVLTEKYVPWVVLSLIVLFVLLIGAEFLSLFSLLNKEPIDSSQKPSQSSQEKKEMSQEILHSSLFGEYVPNELDEALVKKSMLNVVLVGILFADPIENSQVIVRSSNGEERVYKVGDTLPGDAIIKRIMPDGVLVEHDGALESLSLPKEELILEPTPKPLKGESDVN